MTQVVFEECFNPDLDWCKITKQFEQYGRIEIRNIFRPEIATLLQQCLLKQVPWSVACNVDGQQKTIPAHTWQAMSRNDQHALWQRTVAQSTEAFRFWYESFMMVTAYLNKSFPELPLHAFLEYLNSSAFQDKARLFTGFSDIRKVDAQATRYLPGHFLLAHDDNGDKQGEIRRAAYVLSLSEGWHPDWGGLLHFYENGQVVESFIPRFNSLFVFRTPQMHAVSYVAPYATKPRLSITGWFRAD